VRPRGVLALATPLAPTNERLLGALVEQGVRVVHYDFYRPALPDEAFFLPDYAFAASAAVGVLARRGCRRIACATTNPTAPSSLLVFRAAREAAGLTGLEFVAPRNRADSAPLPAWLARRGLLEAGTGVLAVGMRNRRHVLPSSRTGGDDRPGDVPVVGVHDFDAEFDPAPDIPLLCFSWKDRVRRCLEYVEADEPHPARELLKPRLYNPPTGETAPPDREGAPAPSGTFAPRAETSQRSGRACLPRRTSRRRQGGRRDERPGSSLRSPLALRAQRYCREYPTARGAAGEE
jgi:hypothetical protein